MLKSTKHSFLKVELKDRDKNASLDMLKEARKAAEKSIFIDAGKVVADLEPATMSFMEKSIPNIAYHYVVPTKSVEHRYNIVAVFNKENDKLRIHLYVSAPEYQNMFPLLGRFTVDKNYTVSFKDSGSIALNSMPDIAKSRKQLAYGELDRLFALLDYEFALKEDVTSIYAITKLKDKVSYNNYIVTERKQDNVEIINTIEYTYEATVLDLEANMLENLPFNKFYLKIGFIGDEIDPVYALFDHGKLHGIMKPKGRGSIVSVGYVDLNEAKLGSPINVNVSKVKGFLAKDGYDIQDVALMLNILSKAYIEFMYKFHRLVPYSENVSNSYSEHITHVINNTSVHKIVILNPDSKKLSTQGHKGGTHASPREHIRIGHPRRYKSGKEIWIDEKTINEGKVGKITKTYKMVN